MVKTGGKPLIIEASLNNDRTIPLSLQPTDKQIRSAIYNKTKESVVGFSLNDMRSYIAKNTITGTDDPRYESLQDDEIFVISSHSGNGYRILKLFIYLLDSITSTL